MNTWKKLGAVLLASVLLLSGCAKAPASQSGTGSYKAGSYTAEAQGMNGAVKVTVTVDQDKIVSVTVDEHNETPGISDGAIEKLPQMIVDQQSLALDAVSGATFTSKAILKAAEKALTEAGGDLEALKALPGITGYIMKKGDRLWDVAKRFHTTVDHVMEMNELDQEEVKEGQRLLLVKELR